MVLRDHMFLEHVEVEAVVGEDVSSSVNVENSGERQAEGKGRGVEENRMRVTRCGRNVKPVVRLE